MKLPKGSIVIQKRYYSTIRKKGMDGYSFEERIEIFCKLTYEGWGADYALNKSGLRYHRQEHRDALSNEKYRAAISWRKEQMAMKMRKVKEDASCERQ
jgi:hypothetical protein